MGHVFGQVFVEGLDPLQGLLAEHLLGLHGHDGHVVPAELVLEDLVAEKLGVLLVQEALGGGVDADPGQPRTQPGHQGQDAQDYQPTPLDDEPGQGFEPQLYPVPELGHAYTSSPL